MDLKEQLKSLSAQDRKELLKQLQQEGLHVIHNWKQPVLHFKHELRTEALIGIAPVTLAFLLFLLELFQKLLPVLGGQAF